MPIDRKYFLNTKNEAEGKFGKGRGTARGSTARENREKRG